MHRVSAPVGSGTPAVVAGLRVDREEPIYTPTKSPGPGSTLHVRQERPARIGLVLGGGGASGLAFRAGSLWALHHDLGWDPRAADIIVGALPGSDVTPEDLAAWATDADRRVSCSDP